MELKEGDKASLITYDEAILKYGRYEYNNINYSPAGFVHEMKKYFGTELTIKRALISDNSTPICTVYENTFTWLLSSFVAIHKEYMRIPWNDDFKRVEILWKETRDILGKKLTFCLYKNPASDPCVKFKLVEYYSGFIVLKWTEAIISHDVLPDLLTKRLCSQDLIRMIDQIIINKAANGANVIL